MYRKIKLTVKTKDLEKVLKNLKFSEEFDENTTQTFIAEIEDTKSNYEYLAKSSEIYDWDFYNEDDSEIEKSSCDKCNNDCKKFETVSFANPFSDFFNEITSTKELPFNNSSLANEEENSDPESKEITKIVNYFLDVIKITEKENLELILSSVFQNINRFTGDKVDSLFSERFFKENIYPLFDKGNSDTVKRDIILTKFIVAYYKDFSIKDATTNLIYNIKKNWEYLKSCSNIPNLIWIMFGKDTEEIVNLLTKL